MFEAIWSFRGSFTTEKISMGVVFIVFFLAVRSISNVLAESADSSLLGTLQLLVVAKN